MTNNLLFPTNSQAAEKNVTSQQRTTPQINIVPPPTRPTSLFDNLSQMKGSGVQSIKRAASDITNSPRISSESMLLNSPTVENFGSPISFPKNNIQNTNSNIGSKAFVPIPTNSSNESQQGTNKEMIKEKYIGSIKLELTPLVPDIIGPANTLSIEKEKPNLLFIHYDNQKLAQLPLSTSSWLSILLDSEKIRVIIKGSTSERNNKLFLFIQVYLIIEKLKKTNSMNDEEKMAWNQLSEAVKNRPLSSAVSAPVLRTYNRSLNSSPIGSPNGSQLPVLSSEDNNERSLKRSGTEINLLDPSPLKVAKVSEDQLLHPNVLTSQFSSDSIFNSGDCMTQRLFDNLNRCASKEEDPASSLLCELRPYQKQALCWLIEREQEGVTKNSNSNDDNTQNNGLPPNWSECETSCGKKYYYNQLTKTTQWEFPMGDMHSKKSKTSIRGGILADEMGMGKTIEILSLILSNTPHLIQRNLEIESNNINTNNTTTIDNNNNSTNPLFSLNNNNNNSNSINQLNLSSVTNTSATNLISPSSSVTNSNTRKSNNNDNSNNNFINLGAPRSTLVVCPLSVLTQWTKEMERHSKNGFLSIYVYHGQNRKKDPKFLHDHDVVVTTYATLATELPTDEKSKRITKKEGLGVLLRVPWLRVVLDEAHMIKDRTTKTAKASFQLKAERRWCVTGTPIQNKLDDLFSLLHFLQVEPFCDYNWWNQVIMKPIRNRDEKGFARLQTILQSILLRRTKTQKINNTPIVTLPPRIMKVRKIPFMKEEEDFYKALWANAKTKFNKYVEVGTVLRNYAHILELLLRLRQACDHPNLVVASRSKNAKDFHKIIEKYLKESSAPGNFSDKLQEITERCNISDIECLICLESIDTPMIAPCGHLFCKECIEREFTNCTNNDTKCPVCSYPASKKNLIPLPNAPPPLPSTSSSSSSIISSSNKGGGVDQWNTSSKIEALLQELVALWRQDSSIKSIVFSQWTSMLNLVETPLRELGVSFVRLDGSMSQGHRENAVQSFNNDPKVKVFLISMKAGGLGLNLVSASTVFLLDPWWNPATEQQAIDRVHRLGQKRPVVVTRFIISGTIEERILELQDKKRRLVQGALGRHSKELRKFRLDELRLLFRD